MFAIHVRLVQDFGMFEYPKDPFDFLGVGYAAFGIDEECVTVLSNSRTTFGVILPSVRMGVCDRLVCIMVVGFKSDISSAFICRTRAGISLSEESELVHIHSGLSG